MAIESSFPKKRSQIFSANGRIASLHRWGFGSRKGTLYETVAVEADVVVGLSLMHHL